MVSINVIILCAFCTKYRSRMLGTTELSWKEFFENSVNLHVSLGIFLNAPVYLELTRLNKVIIQTTAWHSCISRLLLLLL